MKAAFASDLHFPFVAPEVLAALAEEIAAFAPDVLCVLGDVGESLDDVTSCLKVFREMVACPILVIAGNHDLWLPRGEVLSGDSLKRWETELPAAVAAAGCTWAEGRPFIKDGVALAGSIAWYDYSAADPSIRADAETFRRHKRYFNVDALRIVWRHTDPEFAGIVGAGLLANLDELEANPAVRQTVVYTHVPLLECQMCRKPDNHDWGFSNAYFGNLTLGEQVLQRRKVTHIISGHTHIGRHAQARLNDGRLLDARVLNSQYGQPAWAGITFGATGG